MIKNKGIFILKKLFFILLIFYLQEINSQINTPPIANIDVATVDQDQTLNVPSGAPDYYSNLLDNDTDADADILTITRFSIDGGLTWINANSTGSTAAGNITINDDGTYTFVPTPGYFTTSLSSIPESGILYEIFDGEDTATSTLYLTVETTDDLIEIVGLSSCNQGYTADGQYKIRYSIVIQNNSITRGYHENSEISNIQLIDDLNAVFGDCIEQIDRNGIYSNAPSDFLNDTYPQDWTTIDYDEIEFHHNDATPGAQGILDNSTAKLYPQQRLNVFFCVYVDPNCGGRVTPTLSGNGYDFDNVITVTSNRGNDTRNLIITDFHTTETTVSANLFLEDVNNSVSDPNVEPDLTYDYTNTVIIKNDGTATANNVNYNMGLGNFLNNGIVFQTLDIIQDSGPAVAINNNFNGDNETLLLENGNSLNAGEVVILKIHYIVQPMPSVSTINWFSQLQTSMTQGTADGQGSSLPITGIDEFSTDNRRAFSYVIWDDAYGNHLDRYYTADTDTEEPSSNDQCSCSSRGMRFQYNFTVVTEKTLISTNPAPNGILEHKELTFNVTIRNGSPYVQTVNLQLTDNIDGICSSNILSVSNPVIIASNATTNPNLNPLFNGVTDINIFDGASGVLDPPPNPGVANPDFQEITVEYKVVISDGCDGFNIATFSAEDALGSAASLISNPVEVTVFSDTDNDGIINMIDIDDDNDGITDLVELNGNDPLLDNDNDNIPNYRDTDFGADINNDGIVDLFDFDMDGVPNHFDLDSDNDGIMDIIEAGGIDTDNNGLVPINGDQTLILDADFDGLTDDLLVDTDGDNTPDIPVDVDVAGGIAIPNLDFDGDSHVNAQDIDSDNDGIVDNIEAQTSTGYTAPSAVNTNGTVYVNGLTPIDTENDGIPDYLDLNSENDYRDDIIEAWDINGDGNPNTIPSNNDTDNDGLDNNFDNYNNSATANNGELNASNNNQLPTNFPNVDNSTTDELDWRELPAIIVIIDDVEVIEGQDLVFTLKLVSIGNNNISKTSTTDVIINIITIDGTGTTDPNNYDIAKSGFDFDETQNFNTVSTITIPIGDSQITVTIPTRDDTIDEVDEFMTLNCTITSPNTVNPNTNPATGQFEANVELKGIGTIHDNDDAPDLIMNDDIQLEGDDLIHIVQINPTAANPTTSSSRPITVEIITTDDTAINPDDYTNTSPDSVTINGSEDPDNENTFIDFHIITILDGLNEPDHEFVSVKGTVIDGIVGTADLDKTGTIIDRQPDPLVLISDPQIVEGGILEFIFTLENPITNEPMENFEDISLNIFTVDGSARNPDDYFGVSTQITIPANTLTTTYQITTNDDLIIEDSEDLVLHGTITTFNTDNNFAEGTGTIIDNDLPNLFSPNNDGLSDVFEVISLMQYLEFKMQIFDRWGSEVYNYENKGNPQPLWWDGTIKGNPVPEGVYYYTIDYNDSITEPKSGFIQLIR